MSGYPNQQFRPDDTMTRAEFAAVIVKAFPNAPIVRGAPNFADVSQDFWGAAAIQTAYERGFLAGYPNNLFKPMQAISRVQAMVIIANTQARLSSGSSAGIDALGSDAVVLSRFFEDESAIPNYARSAIAHATRRSLVVNYPNIKQLSPNDDITRGEATALLCRINEDDSDARHYVAADYVPAFGYVFDAAGNPTTALPEPVALRSFDSKLDDLILWEGIEMGENLFFIDNEASPTLWRTDGTADGTQLVRALYPNLEPDLGPNLDARREDNSTARSAWAAFAGIGDGHFWMLSQQDLGATESSTALWGSDGTTDETRKVTDFDLELAEAIAQSELVSTGGYPAIAANERIPVVIQSNIDRDRTTSQLWITDGRSGAGTEMLTTFSSTTTYDNGLPTQQFTATDDYQFFIATANERGPYDLVWTDLWRTDGTPEGTRSLRSFGSLDPDLPLLPWQNRVFFIANTPEVGEDLWVSDGTTAGTRLLKDINPGIESAEVNILGRTEEALYWLAKSANGVGLWKTQGTPESTQLVKQITAENRFTSGYFYAMDNGRFFFSASTQSNPTAADDSFELWVSDGTQSGTLRIEESVRFHSGEAVSMNEQLFFAQDGFSGVELCLLIWINREYVKAFMLGAFM